MLIGLKVKLLGGVGPLDDEELLETVTYTVSDAALPVDVLNTVYVTVYLPQASFAELTVPCHEPEAVLPIGAAEPLPQLSVMYVVSY